MQPILQIEYNYVNNYNQDYLTAGFYSQKINDILDDYQVTKEKIEFEINEDWNCEEIEGSSTPGTNQFIYINLNNLQLICNKYLEGNIISYNEYDFNVVKLREGMDYIKYLYKNLENLFTTFDFDFLMDSNEIKQQNIMMDNKDIIKLYKNSEIKLTQLNQESKENLKDVYSYYLEDIQEIIINEDDFNPNYEKFAKMLKLTDENFKSEVYSQINNITSNIFGFFEEYKNFLRVQFDIAKSYDEYNFNYINFKEFFDGNILEIENKFEEIIPKINKIAINDDYIFNNALRKKMYALYFEKSSEFKKIVEDLNKIYDIKPFNLTFNIEDTTKFIIKRLLDNTVFKYIYDYMEAYEFNKHIYRNTILRLVKEKYDIINNTLNVINANFLDEMYINRTPIIDNDYIIEYRENYTRCLNYPLEELNAFLRKDEENYQKLIIYNNRKSMCENKPSEIDQSYVNDIDIEALNITNSDIIEKINGIKQNANPPEEDDLNQINDFLISLCDETHEFVFTNQTEILLDCHNNLYYAKNITYLEDFDEQIKNKLSELIRKSIEEIDSFYLGGEFLENYLFSNDYIKLNHWENFSTGEINYHVYNFFYKSDYIYKTMEIQYNEFLRGELIESFETSSRNFAQNTLLVKMKNNLDIFVFGKIDINLEFILAKIKSETDYYLTILDKMNRKISEKSKADLISLYDNYLKETMRETIQSQVEDYIKENITFFYRENKYIFKEMFINHYLNNATEKFSADNIFHLYSSLKKLILNNSFNETLEGKSKQIWEQLLINRLNDEIGNKLTSVLPYLNNEIDGQKSRILEKLVNEHFLIVNNNIADLYQIISNQIDEAGDLNTLFTFSINNLPKEKYENFIQSYFEIPLNKITFHYNETQFKINAKVEETTKIENIPDSFLVIEEKYNIPKQMDDLFEIIKATYINLINYTNDFTNDIDDYDEILSLYTFIDTSSNELRSLNDYLRGNKRNLGELENKVLIKKDKKLISQIKRLAEKNINNNKKIDDSNSEKDFIHITSSSNSKEKRKLITHSDNGSATNRLFKEENLKFIETIKDFNRTYLGEIYENIKNDWQKEINKINKYIKNLNRTKAFVALKFASIVSQEKINELTDYIYFKFDRINQYLIRFIALTSNQNSNYRNLLDKSSKLLQDAFEEVDKKIIYNFIILKEFIIGQIKEINGINYNEETDGNKRHKDVFNNGYLYQPIKINNMKGSNNNQNGINFNKAETVNEFYKLLKYSKNIEFYQTNGKFITLNNLLHQSASYLINSPIPDVSSIINDVIDCNEIEYNEADINFNLIREITSIIYDVHLSQNNIL